MTALSTFTVFATTRIMQLAAINLIALCLIALGLGLFGLAPALVACLWATARLEEKSTGALVAGMWREYRREFLRANTVVLPLLALAAGLLALAVFGGGLVAGIWLALAVLVLQSAVAALVTLARLSGSVPDAIANAVTATTLAPYRFLAAVALIGVVAIAVVWQPMLGLYFALSGWALGATLLVGNALASAIPHISDETEVLP